MGVRVKLHNVRIVFPKLFDGEAEAFNGEGNPYYSASWLIARDHPDFKALEAALVEAAKQKWDDKWQANLAAAKAKDKLPVHDGAIKQDKYPEYKGMMYVSARNDATKNPPVPVFDRVLDPKTGKPAVLKATDGKVYSGAYTNVILDLFGYSTSGIGIGASIAGVQFASDGDRLTGGSPAAADDFEAVKAAGDDAAKDAASLFG